MMFFVLIFLAISPFLATSLPSHAKCTHRTAIQRKEWSSSTVAERHAYINGIKCLQELPTRLPEIPASQSFYSDFAAIHVNMTLRIHFNGIFYSWHRHFIHILEKALHEHCSYPSYLGVPYWNWPLYVEDGKTLETSALFSGSNSSLGSNGIYDPSVPNDSLPDGSVLPRGTGGGCVYRGPFAYTNITFGPFPPSLLLTGVPSNWTERNLRCLPRDLNDDIVRSAGNQQRIDAALAQPDIESFTHWTNDPGFTSLHVHGHAGVGMTMNDAFGSPQDPVFFLHHAMVDRVWTLWQDLGPDQRRFTYNGTTVIFNPPNAPLVNNDTVLTWGVLSENKNIWELADPMAENYCYKYM